MLNYYDFNSYFYIVKECDDIAEKIYHAKLRPRKTKYQTTAFYNFRHKKKKLKK